MNISTQQAHSLYTMYNDYFTNQRENIDTFYIFAERNKDMFEYYVEKVGDVINKDITTDGATLYNCGRTALSSGLLIWDTAPMSYNELYENYLKQYKDLNNKQVTITIKPMFTRAEVNIYNNILSLLHIWYRKLPMIVNSTSRLNTGKVFSIINNIQLYFPNLFKLAMDSTLVYYTTTGSLLSSGNNVYTIKNTTDFIAKTYYVYTSCTEYSLNSDVLNYMNSAGVDHSKFVLNMLCGYGNLINSSNTDTLNTVTIDSYEEERNNGTDTITVDLSDYVFTVDYLYDNPMYQTNECNDLFSTVFAPKTSITMNRYMSLFSYDDSVSLFDNDNHQILSLNLTDAKLNNNKILSQLKDNLFFTNGIAIVIYFAQVPNINTIISSTALDPSKLYFRSYVVASTILQNNTSIQLRPNSDDDEKNQIDEVLNGADEDPAIINECKEWCIFNSLEGYRLVVWARNNVYMSEAGDYNYFKEANKKVYPEPVVKVLSFKDMLLVFTTQNMYSMFPYEITEQVQDGTDDEGNPKYVQQKRVIYNTLPVLYNLYTDKRYKDVIQVYNGMILFYSADGQLYLISPSTQIDTDTQFSLKYINKSVNDILLNYDKYINERLSVYYNTHDFEFVSKEKDGDILITASVSISNIKIYYSVPKYTYTYILIYDITNNRYTVYDTATFGEAQSILQTNMYDLVITKSPSSTLSAVIPYTEPNVVDNNCDLTTVDNYTFIQHDIMTELDTGIIYLNNQWKKRFRTLQTTYKNIDANDLLFNLDVIVDDIFISSTMGDTLVLKNIDANNREALYYVSEDKDERADLVRNPNIKEEDLVKNIPVNRITPSEFLRNNQKLFDFSSYSSNKIITHYTNIPSLGKHIELRLRFNSKGKYKLQGFTLVYKEHSV